MNKRTFDFIPEACMDKAPENLDYLEHVISLAVEIAREGREGRKVGTIFTVFNAGKVMSRSRCMILDPLAYHDSGKKRVTDSNLRETIKELSLLDGAFVVDDNGVVLSACRHLDVVVEGIDLPLGFGSRHMAAASISKISGCVAIAVSESSIVRIFVNGKIVSEIIPEVWLLKKYSVHLEAPYSKRNVEQMTMFDKDIR